jgi:hypothetical protein
MTPQEIFDTVAKHLFTQGCRSIEVDDEGEESCLYRAPEGRMCAVGVLIPDELYDGLMEHQNSDMLLETECHAFPEWMSGNKRLLFSLQRVHDSSVHWEDSRTMRAALLGVAHLYELSPAVLDGLSFAKEGAVDAAAR